MNERDMLERLRRRYCIDRGNGPAAVLLPQVRNAAGFYANRSADALVMQLYPSRGLYLEGFEIKCSRSDVLREFKDPTKAEAFSRYCDRWWLVIADPKLASPDELPDEWGLLAAHGDGLRVIRQATVNANAPDALPKTLLASIFRQFDRSYGRPLSEEVA